MQAFDGACIPRDLSQSATFLFLCQPRKPGKILRECTGLNCECNTRKPARQRIRTFRSEHSCPSLTTFADTERFTCETIKLTYFYLLLARIHRQCEDQYSVMLNIRNAFSPSRGVSRSFSSQRSVGLVRSRRASFSRKSASDWAGFTSAVQFSIISGIALGCDTA